jgi:hypothetical protein
MVCSFSVCAGSASSIRTALKLTRPMGVLVSAVRLNSDCPEVLLPGGTCKSVDGPTGYWGCPKANSPVHVPAPAPAVVLIMIT